MMRRLRSPCGGWDDEVPHEPELNMTVRDLVSVILPNRNHAHYLPIALDALLAQTWRNLEIRVVDDASSDGSVGIVSAYAERDSRVRLFRLSERRGVNGALEVGRSHASGEYLYAGAADDFVAPTFFEVSITQLMRHPDAGLCFSDPTEFYELDQRMAEYPLYLSEKPVHFDPSALKSLLQRNYFHISANTAVYRTEAVREAGGYRTDLGWLSDWFVTLAVALRHGACYVPGTYTFLRVRSDSFSATTLRDRRSHRQTFDRFLGLLAERNYADVATAMHAAGLLPEYRLRTLVWLLESPEGRKFVTPRIVGRTILRFAWSYLRPLAPAQLRQGLRQVSSAR